MSESLPSRSDRSPEESDPASQVAAGLAKLALVFRHEAWQATGDHGLPPTQAQILAVIHGTATPIGVSAVARQLAITVGTTSAAVSTLVEKGLVTKQRSSADGRALTLALTARGRRVAASAGAWPEAILSAASSLPARDQAGLVRGLVGLIRRLQEKGSVPTARMCVECRFFRPNEYAGETKAHHCHYIDAPIGDSDLRVDCAEMEPASADVMPQLWSLLIEGQRLNFSLVRLAMALFEPVQGQRNPLLGFVLGRAPGRTPMAVLVLASAAAMAGIVAADFARHGPCSLSKMGNHVSWSAAGPASAPSAPDSAAATILGGRAQRGWHAVAARGAVIRRDLNGRHPRAAARGRR